MNPFIFLATTTSTTNSASTGWQANSITGALESDAFNNVSNTISQTGNSAIYLGMMIIGFLGVIGLLIACAGIMFGNSVTRSDQKTKLLWILVALIIAFGAIAIVGLAQVIGSGLFSTGTTTASLSMPFVT